MDIWSTFSFLSIFSLVSSQRKQKWFQIFFVNKSWEERATKLLLNTYFITVLKLGGKFSKINSCHFGESYYKLISKICVYSK